jgi:histidyl-tRNA synthetase
MHKRYLNTQAPLLSMVAQTPKGVRDFLPPQKIIRNRIVSVLTEYFERFGYNPIETPALELYATLCAKHAGGAEILKETYKLADQGGRELALRYDLTVPFARIVAQNPQLKFPFKRYAIDRVWRDGPLKPGRYREFWQCDCDVAGAKAPLAEAELLALAQYVFDELNLKFTITVNHRSILDEILTDVSDKTAAILAIDKLKKIGESGVRSELEAQGISTETVTQILIKLKWDISQFTQSRELIEIMTFAKDFGAKDIVFDPSLARGLSYYTGIVYEGFLQNSDIKSSICAGGRYDEMIGKFSNRPEIIPACGISFGLDVISDALENYDTKSIVDVYIISVKEQQFAIKLAKQLRESGVKTDVDINDRSMSKAMKFATEYGIPYVLVVGENERATGQFMLKNMADQSTQSLTLSELIFVLQKYNSKL